MSSQDAPASHGAATLTRARSTAAFLLCGGVAITLFALYLYVTGLSRAVALWTSPLGAVMIAVGAWSQRTHRPAPPRLLLLVGVVALALLGLGLTTLVYALAAVNTTV